MEPPAVPASCGTAAPSSPAPPFPFPLLQQFSFHLFCSQKVIKQLSSSNNGIEDILSFPRAPKGPSYQNSFHRQGGGDEQAFLQTAATFLYYPPPATFFNSGEILSRKVALQEVKAWLNVCEDSLDNIPKALQGASQDTTNGCSDFLNPRLQIYP